MKHYLYAIIMAVFLTVSISSAATAQQTMGGTDTVSGSQQETNWDVSNQKQKTDAYQTDWDISNQNQQGASGNLSTQDSTNTDVMRRNRGLKETNWDVSNQQGTDWDVSKQEAKRDVSSIKDELTKKISEIKEDARKKIDKAHDSARNDIDSAVNDPQKVAKLQDGLQKDVGDIRQEASRKIQSAVDGYQREVQGSGDTAQWNEMKPQFSKLREDADKELDQMVQAAQTNLASAKGEVREGFALSKASAGIIGQQNESELNAADLMSATGVLGKSIKDQQGETLGEVEDIVYNNDGKIEYVILSYGGFMGIGDKRFAISYNDVSAQGNDLTLNVDGEVFKYNEGLSSAITWKNADPSIK